MISFKFKRTKLGTTVLVEGTEPFLTLPTNVLGIITKGTDGKWSEPSLKESFKTKDEVAMELLGQYLPPVPRGHFGCTETHYDRGGTQLSTELANEVYDLLVQYGADPEERDSFVLEMTARDATSEWRFRGFFGFGGKFRNESQQPFRASFYWEDHNPWLAWLLANLNLKLDQLYQKRVCHCK